MVLENRPMFYPGMGTEENRYGGYFKTLNWKKAREICEANPKSVIKVGLAEDWTYTHAVIFDKGEYKRENGSECGICVSSKWATPVVVIDSGDPIECSLLTDEWERDFPDDWAK